MPTLQHAQFVALIVLCFYKSVTQAQVVGRGDSCPQLTAVSNFDLAKVGRKTDFFPIDIMFVLDSRYHTI